MSEVIFLLITFTYDISFFIRFFVTPSDSVAIIAANAVDAIPYFSGGLKGVARFSIFLSPVCLNVSFYFWLTCTCVQN